MRDTSNNNIINKSIPIFLIFTMLSYFLVSSISLPFLDNSTIAYAEDKKETKKEDKKDKKDKKETKKEDKKDDAKEEIETKQNVYDALSGDTAKLKIVKDSVKYDKQMQYLMTYSILSETYLGVDKYSGLYTQDNAWGDAGNNLDITINTGYSNVLDVKNASNSAEEKKENEKEEKGDSKEDKKTKELIKYMQDKVYSLYSRKYGLNYSTNSTAGDVSNFTKNQTDIQFVLSDNNRNSSGNLSVADKNMKAYIKTIATRVGVPVREGTRKNFFIAGYGVAPTESFISNSNAKEIANNIKTEKTLAYTVVKNKLDNIVSEAVLSGDLNSKLLNTKEPFLNSSLADGIGAEFDKKNEGSFKNNFISAPSVMQGTVQKRELLRMPIYSKSGKIDGAYPTYKQNVRQLRVLPSNQKTNTNFKGIYDGWIKDTKASLKKDIKDYEKTLEKNKKNTDSGKGSSDKAKNTKTMAWIPLHIDTRGIYSKLDKGDKEKFAEFVKKFDGGTMDKNGQVMQDTKTQRYLRVNDFLNLQIKSKEFLKQSASPYLTSHYKQLGNREGDARIGTTNEYLGVGNLGSYAGMGVMKTSAELSNSLNLDFTDKDKGIATKLSSKDILNSNNKKVTKSIAMATSNVKKLEIEDDAKFTMGVDNYGNLIMGETLQVVVPYWQNNSIKEFVDINSGANQFAVSNTLSVLDTDSAKTLATIYSDVKPLEKSVKIGKTFNISKANAEKLENHLSKTNVQSGDNVSKLGNDVKTTPEIRQAYAMAITIKTQKEVEAFNKRFLKVADKGKLMYLVPSESLESKASGSKSEQDKIDEFTAKDLLEKLRVVFENGVYDLIRLSLASGVISFYTSNIQNFSMGAMFHTSTITETAMWSDLVPTLIILLVSVSGVYLLVMTIKVLRRTMTIGKMLQQFVMLSLVLLIPTIVYTPLINLALNTPTEKILGNQLEQMSIVDTMLENETDLRKYNDKYKLFFGNVEELRERKDDYIIKLYTTTHIDGFDIDTVTYDELSDKNKFRNASLIETGKWRKDDLVSVDVSIYDIFKWATKGEEVGSLFGYLEKEDATKYKDVSKYTEYAYDGSVQNDALGINVVAQKWTASDLYKLIYQNTTNEKISASINSVFDITQVFRNRDNETSQNKITQEDKKALIRDLAMTGESRKMVFGDEKLLSAKSMELYTQYSNVEFIPESDIFGLQAIVDTLVPYRNPMKSKSVGDTYEINKRILDDYISNYSIVREVIGKENSKVKMAEFKVITLNMWFELNKVLEVPMFPTEFRADTISLDSYLRLVYIPINAYKNLEDKGLDSVGKYVGLRYHPVALLMFLFALLCIFAFGFIYVAVFYIVMMIMMVASFVYNYIIKNNYDSKAWLGSLFIIGTFALAKAGLMAIWYGMSAFLNYSFVKNGGETYAYVTLHSVIIIVYIGFMILKVFKKVFKNVMEDKANLGASGFIRDTKAFGEKFASLTNSAKRKALNSNGSGGKSFGKGISKTLGGEGRLGFPSKAQMSAVASAFSVGSIKGLASNSKNKVGDSIDKIKHRIYGTDEDSVNFEENLTNKSLGGIKGASAKKLARDYLKIEDKNFGISDKDKKLLGKKGVGKVLHSTAKDGNRLSELSIGNVEVAKKMVKDFKKKGIKATATDEGNLLFDSTKVNLDNAEDRKALFGDTIDDLVEETSNIELAKSVDYEADDSTVAYSNSGNNTYDIEIGKNGLSNNNLDNIINRPEFKENFELLNEPMKDANGNYLDGNLQVRAKTTRDKVDSKMEMIGNLDTALRNSSGEASRVIDSENGNNKSLSINGKYDDTLVKPHLKEGMSMQGNRVLYNENDKTHVSAVKKMKKLMNTEIENGKKDKSDIATRLVAQTTLGGNNGYAMAHANTNDSPEARNIAVNSGIIDAETDETTVFVGNDAKQVAKQMGDISKIASVGKETLTNYQDSKNKLSLYASGGLDATNNVESKESYVSDMLKNAETLGFESNKLSKSKEALELLQKQKDTGQVTPEIYNSQLTTVKLGMEKALNEEGNLSKVQYNTLQNKADAMSKVIEESTDDFDKQSLIAKQSKMREALGDYSTSNNALTKLNIKSESIDKYIKDDGIGKIEELSKNITDVDVNKDGTIVVKTVNGTMNPDDIGSVMKQLKV